MDRPGNISLRESLDASHVAMPRRHRIEDVAAAERRLTAEVSAGRPRSDHRRSEAQLREAFAEAHDPRWVYASCRGAAARALVLDRGDLLERNVEPIRRRIPAGSMSASPRATSRPIDSGKAHRDALAASARLTSWSCTWTLRTRMSRPDGSSRS
jgi:hypothetical protein